MASWHYLDHVSLKLTWDLQRKILHLFCVSSRQGTVLCNSVCVSSGCSQRRSRPNSAKWWRSCSKSSLMRFSTWTPAPSAAGPVLWWGTRGTWRGPSTAASSTPASSSSGQFTAPSLVRYSECIYSFIMSQYSLFIFFFHFHFHTLYAIFVGLGYEYDDTLSTTGNDNWNRFHTSFEGIWWIL